MATNLEQQISSVNSGDRTPTPWQNEVWQNDKTAALYGFRGGSYNFDNSWQKYIGGNARLEIFDPQKEEHKPIEFSNRLFDSWQKAVAEKKPLVVEFSQEGCGWCKKLDEETMSSSEVAAHKDKAVWVRLDPTKDEDDKGNVAQLAQDLKIDRFPTTVVLNVTETAINEAGRIIGFFNAKDMANNLDQILPKKESPRTQLVENEQTDTNTIDNDTLEGRTLRAAA